MVQKLVAHLEMRGPHQLHAAAPVEGFRLVRLSDPAGADAARIRALHDAIATPHLWSSLGRSLQEWRPVLGDSNRSHWVAIADGRDIGWASLTLTDEGEVEIASFGIRPDAVGHGYGGAFLTALVREAWALLPESDRGESSPRVWLHTSSWDHPHALANYLARGFTVANLELQEQQAGRRERASTLVGEPPPVIVRPAVPTDAPSVSTLVADLGYERPVTVVRRRLARMSTSAQDLVAVAVEDTTRVVGVIAAHVVPLFAEADTAFLRITALSVAPNAVRKGIGRRLVEFAEYFARLHGCQLIEVSSARRPEREPAHHFYRSIGFEDTAPSSVRYWKRLEEGTR